MDFVPCAGYWLRPRAVRWLSNTLTYTFYCIPHDPFPKIESLQDTSSTMIESYRQIQYYVLKYIITIRGLYLYVMSLSININNIYIHSVVILYLCVCGVFREGCPILPGSSMQKTIAMLPTLEHVKGRYGVALEDQISENQEHSLASSVL